MSFDLRRLERIGSGLSLSNALWSYTSPDSMAAITGVGYFAEANSLKVGDNLVIAASDSADFFRVTSIGVSATIEGLQTPAYVPPKGVLLISSSKTDQENFVDQGMFFNDNPAVYPNGYYMPPPDFALLIEEGSEHSLPIRSNPDSSLGNVLMAVAPTLSSLTYVGGTGNGPLNQEDAGIVCDANMVCSGVSISNLSCTGVLCNSSFVLDNILMVCNKSFSVYKDGQIFSSGRNFILLQQNPSTVTLGAAEKALVQLSNFSWGNAGFVGSTGDIWDLTGADAGFLQLEVDNCNTEVTAGNVSFSVTGDNTVKLGKVNDCSQNTSDIAQVFDGIDEKAINTTFAGNNFQNTLRKGGMAVANNVTATPNPGADVPTKFTATFTASATNSGFAMTSNGTLENIDTNAVFEGNITIDYSIGKQGGGTNQITIYIYKNGAILTDNGVPASRGPLTVAVNDFSGGSIAIPIVSVFGDQFEVWGSVNGTDLVILSSCSFVVNK